ncbi:MAG: HEAT repeat domain-containing protein [Pirellulales bacterium]
MSNPDRPTDPSTAKSAGAPSSPRTPGSPPNLTAEQNLPPVKPPSAAFLVQLFFIPLVIVSIIVSIWLLFSWVAHMSTRPEDLVQDLENLDKKSWQEATTLAQLLRDPSQEALRKNSQMASRLGSILERDLQQNLGSGDQALAHTDFRIYLARAIGSFDVTDGVPALRAAVEHETGREDVDVRRGALQAISLMAGRLGGEAMLQADPKLLGAVVEAARSTSDDPAEQTPRGQLRAIAAFALGILGSADASEQLALMVGDAFPDARYNAATGLARAGDPRALPVLLEMLNPENKAFEAYEREPEDAASLKFMTDDQREANFQTRLVWKRNLVLRNGMQAVQLLLKANPAVAENPDLAAAVERLAKENLPADLKTELKRVQGAMKR